LHLQPAPKGNGNGIASDVNPLHPLRFHCLVYAVLFFKLHSLGIVIQKQDSGASDHPPNTFGKPHKLPLALSPVYNLRVLLP
jgi:hypothetical protein